ncbi:MAG: DUF3108 domain-containing protein [Bacteroidia bacterium]|nr:DUF3108 domain-containing protein [Bacteroidia bacterium]
MKHFLSCILLIVLLSFFSFRSDVSTFSQEAPLYANQTTLRLLKQEAFKRGEKLKYRMHYGWLDAGFISIEVKEDAREIGGRRTYHMVGVGETKGTFDFFFKVRDRYESYVDEEAIAPWIFIRRVNEGGYTINQDYVFNHYKKKVDVGNNAVYDIPEYCQDMISSFYYARCLDYENAKENDVFTINGFVDKEVFPIKIRYIGRETIDSDVGKIRCLKFRPILQKGRIFKREDDLNVWITDDKNHIPVRAQAKILVGSVKMDLTEYSNLANPIAKVN